MKKPIIRGGSAALATLMTASLVTPMAPVMAAALPSAADTSSITVMNVDHKFNNRDIDVISVTAYKIIEPVYDTANGG